MSGSMSGESQRAANVVAQEFWKDYVSAPGGQMREVHMVRWSRRGDLHYHASVDNVARLMKPIGDEDGGANISPLWAALKPAYEAWVAGQEPPVNGTALDAWPALNKRQAKAFIAAGYTSVEDIAAMPEGDIQKVQLPGVRNLREMARAYVANKSGSAHVEEAMAKQAAEMEALKAQLAELAAVNADMADALRAKASAEADA
jgi:uncharacterized protein YqcC (DUF446 family)